MRTILRCAFEARAKKASVSSDIGAFFFVFDWREANFVSAYIAE
jgi:hypothetical protein